MTASEDGSLKIWILPTDGVNEDICESDATLRGHYKKLSLARFHPTADHTLASSAADNDVRLWDIQNQQCVRTMSDNKNTITGLEWNANGSMLATVTRERMIRIFDPRAEENVLTCDSHEGARPQKVCWLGASDKILTTGFSKMSERQYGIFDIRDFSKPLVMKRFDENTGVLYPYYDEDTGLIFCVGRGENLISFFEFTDKDNFIEPVGIFKGSAPCKGFSFMPKRTMDIMQNELMRGVRLSLKQVEYISFKLPRKTGAFCPDLYPPCISGEATNTFDDWWNNKKDTDPKRIEVNAENLGKTNAHLQEANKDFFKAKLANKVEGAMAAQLFQGINQAGGVPPEVQNKIKELEEENAHLKDLNQKLQKEVEELKSQIAGGNAGGAPAPEGEAEAPAAPKEEAQPEGGEDEW